VIAHGGDVWQVGEELGVSATEILDFSASINPRGLPGKARERLAREASDPKLLSFYPDPCARRLRRALSEQHCVAPEAITVGPGAESLLAPILRYLAARRTLVPVPAFSEYKRVCAQEQIDFVPFPLDRADLFRVNVDTFCRSIEAGSYGVALLNNPHNPSGAVLERHEIQRVVDAATRSGATLVLDEAFVDYVPDLSFIRDAASRPGLIVVRSLTKFYGCPALRVGYAVAHPEAIRRIQALLPTWPVAQFAIDTLAEAVQDQEFAEASRCENGVERERLGESLKALGLFVFPPAANYLFLELPPDMPTAAELRARLISKHQILIRNCDSYEGLSTGRYLRVAVRSAADNCRLIQALRVELRPA
jgi:threonine-phosphate decarboxylase